MGPERADGTEGPRPLWNLRWQLWPDLPQYQKVVEMRASRSVRGSEVSGPGQAFLRVGAAIAVAAASVLVAVGAAPQTSGASVTPILEAWGYNAYGQLGNGTTTNATTPTPVALPSGVAPVATAAGAFHSLAIGSDGNLYAWGQNGYGQLGNGTTTDSALPVVVQLPSGVHATAISAGATDSLALGSDGRVYAWGDNSLDELGNGTAAYSATPVVVSIPAGVTVTAISSGQYHNLALTSTGQIYGWGYDNDGQLGDGRKITTATPTLALLPAGFTAAAIAAGGYHTLAMGAHGGLLSWGYNVDGQLGDGTKTTTGKPINVVMPTGVTATAIAAGLYHSMMLGTDGNVYSWGYNLYGQLGNGTQTASSTPVSANLPSGSVVNAISAEEYSSDALLSSGTIEAWGQNGFGQLGNGTITDSHSPIAVTAPPQTVFTALASDSSSSHTLAIAEPTQSTTTTALSPSTSAPVYGQAETLTATVTGSDGGGTVSFLDGSTPLAGCSSVPLSPSGSAYQAQCTSSTLSATTHNVKAVYSGDTGSLGSSSTVLALTVSPAPLSITGSSAAISYGGTPPAVTAIYSGFVNGDSASSLTTAPTCNTTASPSSPAGTYPTSCSGAVAANYSITYVSGDIAVGPAPLSITASSGTSTYGSTAPSISPIYSGFVNGDTAASLTTNPACTTTATSSSPVGNYPSTCSGAADPNYAISYTAGQVTVDVAALVITASSASTTYGTATGAVTPSYSGFQNGDSAASLTTQPACATSASASSPVGTYQASCSGATDPNYSITYVDGQVSVTPAPLAITASSSSMTYGGSVPSVSPVVTGLQNGEGASVLGTGLQCSTVASPTSAVGNYSSGCSGAVDSNYSITYFNGSVTVTAAPLSITASSSSMAYGGDVPAVTSTVNGLANGEDVSVLGGGLTCATEATSASPIGTYASSCSGAADTNYAITYVGGTVIVSPATLTITASSGSMTYGDQPPSITPSVSGFQNGDAIGNLGAGLLCSTAAQSTSGVGVYTSVCAGAVDSNYTISYVDGSVSVVPAPLTVTAASDAVQYGSAVPAITASYSGFVNGDDATSLTAAPVCTTTATSSSPAGTYPTNCSGASDPNYAISYATGMVVIGQDPLVVTASSATMNYGDSPPTITASYSGFVNGDGASSLTTAPNCTTTALTSSPVGTYTSSCSGAADPNYSITYVDSTVTVAPLPLTVTASSSSLDYGSASPNITPSYTGFVNGDTASSLAIPATCSTPMLPTSPVGTYGSTCSGAADPNYAISYVDGTVTVSAAPITVTASSVTSTYGVAAPTVTAAVVGLQNGEDVSVLGAGLVCSSPVTPTSAVGTYTTSCTGASDANYAFTYVDGTATVLSAALVVTASSGSSAYGASPPTVTSSVTGLQNGETPAVLGAGLACSTTATSTSPVATYPSSCSGAVDANYAISYVDGTVNVVAAPLLVAASSGSMSYGGTPPAIQPSYSGFVNGEDPSVLTTSPTCSTTATAASPVATYPSSCSGATDPNYAISYVVGTVNVVTSPLLISASSGSMNYGGSPPAIQPSFSGFVNGEGPVRPVDPADVLDHRDVDQSGRHLPEQLLGRHRPELRDHLRTGQRRRRDIGARDLGILFDDDLRCVRAVDHGELLGIRER